MKFKSYSQARQDEFVVGVLDGKRDGIYADIGAGDPEAISNTITLEREFGWNGILCDIDTAPKLRKHRKAKLIYGDFFAVEWSKAFALAAPTGRVDYLSLDLEPPELTLLALTALPLATTRFSVATIEHDAYRNNGNIRYAMRGLMKAYGYELVAADVGVKCGATSVPFEDWWIDPTYISLSHARAVARSMTAGVLQ